MHITIGSHISITMEKVKGMMTIISESTISLLNLCSRIEARGGTADIKVDEYMRRFSGDVISRACFGSNYSKREEIFLKLTALQEVMSRKSMSTGIPGMRNLPIKSNREAWALEKEVKNFIMEVVMKKETANKKDLLQMVLEGAKNSDLTQETTDTDCFIFKGDVISFLPF